MQKNESDPHNYDPRQSYAAKQLSRYDMQVAGIVVFVVTIAMLFVVALALMLFRNEPVGQAQAPAARSTMTASASSPAAQSTRAEL
jgi:hypothetical protein